MNGRSGLGHPQDGYVLVATSLVNTKLSALKTCSQGRVLIVDDHRAVAAVFRMILRDAFPAIKIDVARDGREAVTAFEAGHHEAILLDLHMPVLDGRGAYHEIEELCGTRGWQMPNVIFCTGYAPPDSLSNMVESCQTMGILCKPVSSDVLVDAVRTRIQYQAAT